MPHGAIIGMTTSGKTTLGKQLAASFMRANLPTLVLHKPREPWPDLSATWQTENPDEFLWKFARVQSHCCFMELADGLVDKYDSRFHTCFTQGRHDGHRCFYLSQRAATVHPAIRENCESLYLFTVDWDAAKIWSTTFVDRKLLEAPSLPPHFFLWKPNRYTPAMQKHLTVDPPRKSRKK